MTIPTTPYSSSNMPYCNNKSHFQIQSQSLSQNPQALFQTFPFCQRPCLVHYKMENSSYQFQLPYYNAITSPSITTASLINSLNGDARSHSSGLASVLVSNPPMLCQIFTVYRSNTLYWIMPWSSLVKFTVPSSSLKRPIIAFRFSYRHSLGYSKNQLCYRPIRLPK